MTESTVVEQPGAPGAQTQVEAPPETETEQVNGVGVVRLMDTTIPLGRFPRPEDLVGERLDKDLLAQVDAVGGLLQPVIVTTTGKEDPDGPISNDRIADGRRRLQALWALNARDSGKAGADRWGSVPARLVVVPEEGADISTTLLTLVAHSTRRDNDAVTYAAVFKLVQAGNDEKRIAQQTGLSRQTIQRIQRLKRLIPELLAAMHEGRISGWVATKCSALSAADQKFLYDEKLVKTGSLTTAMIDVLRRAQRKAATDTTLEDVDKAIQEQDEAGPPASDDSTAYRDLAARVTELEEENAALRTESEARLARIEEVRAEGERVADELRAQVAARDERITALREDLVKTQTALDENKPADVTTLEAQYESALLDAERLERKNKLLQNEVARARKQTLPYPELAKVKIEDEDAA